MITPNQVVMKICRRSELLRKPMTPLKFLLIVPCSFFLYTCYGLYVGEMYVGGKFGRGFTVTGNELYLFSFFYISVGIALFIFFTPKNIPKGIDDKVIDALNSKELLQMLSKLNRPRNLVASIFLITPILVLYGHALIY